MAKQNPKERCKAKSKTTGQRCQRPAIVGGTVCRYHGGAAPQVMAMARRRILEAIEPLVVRVIKAAMDKDASPEFQHAVCRTLLDKADKYDPPKGEAPGAADGQSTWEEFIQIYRRGNAPSEAE